MGSVDAQIVDGKLPLGEITYAVHLDTNFAANAVHDSIRSVTTESHQDFLTSRRKLMSAYVRRYYDAL